MPVVTLGSTIPQYRHTAQTAADGWAGVTTAHRVTKHTQAVAEIRRGDNKTGQFSD